MSSFPKHPYKMSREELLDANALVTARSKPRADNPEKAPQPTFEERERIAKEQQEAAYQQFILNLVNQLTKQ